MSLRAPRQFIIFIREPLDDFRPRDVGAEVPTERWQKNKTRKREDQSPKTDSIVPPTKTSMGSRFHSYS